MSRDFRPWSIRLVSESLAHLGLHRRQIEDVRMPRWCRITIQPAAALDGCDP